MLSVEEARALILEAVPGGPLGAPETVPLSEALDRVLAGAVIARDPNPPFDASEMDGYALRATDVSSASAGEPVALRVVADVPAGWWFEAEIAPVEAVRIMTGAPVPRGADAVVPVEDTRSEARDRVAILRPARAGAFIRRRGEDFGSGVEVLAAGVPIGPATVALLAAAGLDRARVARRPRVAVIGTGDELVDPAAAEPLRPGQVRSSNNLLLAGLLERAGAEPVDLGIVRDEPRHTEEALERAFGAADAVVTSGGVSVGERDFVKGALERLGATLDFWQVRMKPGKPIVFGRRDGKPFFGLPGNPASTFVTFFQLVRPAIHKMQGRHDFALPLPSVRAIADEVAAAPPGRRAYLRARATLDARDGRFHVRLAGSQAAGAVRSLALANAFLVIPEEGSGRVAAGDDVQVELLEAPHAGP